MVEDFYVSDFVPYGMINYNTKEDFISDYELILELANNSNIEYIFIDYENIIMNNE